MMKKENKSEIESQETEPKNDIVSESTNIEDGSIALKPSAHAGRPSYKNQRKKKTPAEDNDYLSSSKFSLLSDKTLYADPQAKKTKVTFSKNEKKKSSLCEEEEWEKYMKKNGLKPSLGGAPSPSSRVPSFIAMVKTAIRDLKPYKLTNREGIAKYIEIRYRVKNCKLLKYVLKWMVEMDILKKKGCNFHFVKKRMVMDSKSVASCNETTDCKPKKKCPPKRRECPPKRKTCPPKRKTCRPKPKCLPKRNTCRPKPKCPPKRNKCRPEPKCSPKPRKLKCYYRAKSKQCKPKKSKKCKTSNRHEGCERVRCNCYEKLNSKKNRIKLKSRYVKKCGKIYLESVYI